MEKYFHNCLDCSRTNRDKIVHAEMDGGEGLEPKMLRKLKRRQSTFRTMLDCIAGILTCYR